MRRDREAIAGGRAALGIELGSTRIKAVLIGPGGEPLATGGHDWANQLVDGVWTYPLAAVEQGLRAAYAELAASVWEVYGVRLTRPQAIGVSAMMHGYLAFDAEGELLTPFRTWRNTSTSDAAARLTELFGYNIPLRWSIAHLYQAMLNAEAHLPRLAHITTLAGYVHWRLTGEWCLGVGDASGMFPIDTARGGYDEAMAAQFDSLVAEAGLPWRFAQVMPQVKLAGEAAGRLTEAGRNFLDPSGNLQPGVPLAPPEGDAGTGMVATNAVAPRTGNVSVGTSIFAMVVLERPLSKVYRDLDLVTTPAGAPVVMVHCNNGASEVAAWAEVFGEFAAAIGAPLDQARLYAAMLGAALEAEPDAGGLLAYNYLSGEPIAGVLEGRPLVVRTPDSRLTLANLMRAQVSSVFATLAMGMEILEEEGVGLDAMFAHGGLFKTKTVAQLVLAAALRTPVTVSEAASEGGAWGMALLAAYLVEASAGQSLGEYLADVVFQGRASQTIAAPPADVAGYQALQRRWLEGLAIERAATEHS
ncbi:MAG: ATPase [Bifidobacteriaceae bacterium]|nr:ATPase [Bifidobacteriaceae bacterium]